MTKKQKRFVDEYLIDLNATQAAIRAGYKAKNGQRASEIGHELLQKTQVLISSTCMESTGKLFRNLSLS